jgi:hypothetical protein
VKVDEVSGWIFSIGKLAHAGLANDDYSEVKKFLDGRSGGQYPSV